MEGAGTSTLSFQIPGGNTYDKDAIMKPLIEAIAPQALRPLYWKVKDDSVRFYVEDFAVAKALLLVNRKSTLPNGSKMIIKVKNSMPPWGFNADALNLIKQAIENRYSPDTKAADLTDFNSDELLRDVYCGLSDPFIWGEVVDIIANTYPDLRELNLSNNKMTEMVHFIHLFEKLPNLKILNMADNKVSKASLPSPAI